MPMVVMKTKSRVGKLKSSVVVVVVVVVVGAAYYKDFFPNILTLTHVMQ